MLRLSLLLCLLLAGCFTRSASEIAADEDTVTASADDPLPPDLRSRKTGSDWPRFLGPQGTSVSSEKGIHSPWPAAGPKIVWERSIGSGYAMPVVSRGRLFLIDRIRNRARLRCWNAETAESLWTFEYPCNYKDMYNYSGGPRCCPVVDGNRVYIFGAEGMLHCVRATDGKLFWKIDTTTKFGVRQNFFGVGSTPVIEGGLLLVQIGGSPKGSDRLSFEDLKGNGTGLVALDKFTGEIKYKVSNELASYSSPIVTTIGNRRWCFLFARGGLLALEPSSGKIDFHYPWRARELESVNAANPVIVGHRVLISECYEIGSALLEFKPGGYSEVWTDRGKGRKKSLMCHWMTPIHVDGYVYGCSGRHTNEAELRCIELSTGKVMWREPNLTRTSLLLVDGHLISLGEDGTLRLLKVNPKKYEEISSVELHPVGKDGKPDPKAGSLLEYPCWAAPILSNGLLYVRGKDRLVSLELIPPKK
jgi:outer membrane protein assembly factor BamB